MYDTTSRVTFKNVSNWLKDVRRVTPEIPVVMVGTKVDLKEKRIKPTDIMKFAARKGIMFTEISSRARYNVVAPIQMLVEALIGREPISFRTLNYVTEPLPHVMTPAQWEEARKNLCEEQRQAKQEFVDDLDWEEDVCTEEQIEKLEQMELKYIPRTVSPEKLLRSKLYFREYLQCIQSQTQNWSPRLRDSIVPFLFGRMDPNKNLDSNQWFVVPELRSKPFWTYHEIGLLSEVFKTTSTNQIRDEFSKHAQRAKTTRILSSTEGEWGMQKNQPFCCLILINSCFRCNLLD